MGEPVGVGAGFDDGAVVGEPVHDRGAQSWVGEGVGPPIWAWLMFLVACLACYLRLWGFLACRWCSRREGLSLLHI